MACGGPRGAEPHPSCRRVGGPHPSQPPLTVPGLPPGRLVVELSGTSHILPFPGWPCRGPLHPGRSGHPREDGPGWLVPGWTSRQRPAWGGGGRCPAALRTGWTGSGNGLARRPRGWLSTTCRAGPPRVPAHAARRLEPAPGSAPGLQGGGQLCVLLNSHQAPAHVCGPAGVGTDEAACSRAPGPSESHVPLQATAGTTSRLLPDRG